jgi:diacylglycerol kinase (ATP)
MKPGRTGIQRILAATVYSGRGFQAAFRHEAAFRQELALFVTATPLAFYLADNATQFLLLALPLLLVLLTELSNTAIEALVDRFGGEMHELSARAKDIGSAMVFVSLTAASLSWGAILGEKYLW